MSRIEPVKPATRYRKPLRTKKNSIITGVVIVVISVVAINFAIKKLSGTQEFLVASAPAAAGTTLKDLPTRTISLNLGEASADYLDSNAKLAGLVLSQPIASGDLVMKRDVVAANQNAQLVRLAISTKNALPTKLESGTAVDVWAAINDGGGQYGEPALIAQNVQVYERSGASALFGESSNKLEIVVEREMVKPILSAVLHADAISVVARDGAH